MPFLDETSAQRFSKFVNCLLCMIAAECDWDIQPVFIDRRSRSRVMRFVREHSPCFYSYFFRLYSAAEAQEFHK